jgi:hypothetical protein
VKAVIVFGRCRPDEQTISSEIAMCKSLCDVMHMATNVEIDPELIQQALLLGGKRTKREVIEEALQEYVSRREQQQIVSLFGTIDYDDGYDYKKQRARR